MESKTRSETIARGFLYIAQGFGVFLLLNHYISELDSFSGELAMSLGFAAAVVTASLFTTVFWSAFAFVNLVGSQNKSIGVDLLKDSIFYGSFFFIFFLPFLIIIRILGFL